MQIIHYPNLKTVLMVKNAIEEAGSLVTREELKRKLPKKIMHQTLNLILEYLAHHNRIYESKKGITWVVNDSPKLQKEIAKARFL